MKSIRTKFKISLLLFALVPLIHISCSADKKQAENAAEITRPVAATEQVGPVKSVDVSGPVDAVLAERGRSVFEGKCTACHKFDERYVGPALGGITERRSGAWIMNMIITPEEMTKKDPEAKKLLAEYMTQMVNQNVEEDDARAILEYFRSVDQNL